MRRTEFLVVGGGLLGLATAYELSRRGREVTLAERATIGHERAGSKGSARIFRLGYSDPLYVRMAATAQRLWRELELDAGVRLLETTGQITFGAGLDEMVSAMSETGAPWEPLGPRDVATRYPALCVPDRVVFEPESGVLNAERCLDAFLRLGKADVLERTAVRSIVDDGNQVRFRLGAEPGVASVVVLCAGPWTRTLTPGVGPKLGASLEQVAYLRLPDAVPIFIERANESVFGLPVSDAGLLKIGLHGAGPTVDPDSVAIEDDEALLARLSDAVGRILRGVEADFVSTERCFYDNSPDEDFVLDRVGRIVVAAGTSGHGFKFGPLLGQMVADLATGAAPAFDLSRFAWGRSVASGRSSM